MPMDSTGRVTVAGTPVVTLATETADFAGSGSWMIRNLDGADTIYFSKETPVASTDGFPLLAGEILEDLVLSPGESLYGACAAGGTAIAATFRNGPADVS